MNTDNIIIHSDGALTAVKPRDFKKFTLEELQAFVGGFIQIVNLAANKLLVVNEEGKLHNLPVNEKATALALSCNAIFPTDYIVGDAVVIESTMLD